VDGFFSIPSYQKSAISLPTFNQFWDSNRKFEVAGCGKSIINNPKAIQAKAMLHAQRQTGA
jgi:hypothetical protein